MASPVPPIKANTEIDIEDSCNCCWGRSVKKSKQRKLTPAEEAFADTISHARDANEVYDLHVSVDVTRSPRHVRKPTQYPHDPSTDAGSTESTQPEGKS